MIKVISIVNRFRMQLVINDMFQPPNWPWALISIYSSPEEELVTRENFRKIEKMGCQSCLSQMFQDGSIDDEWLDYPFLSEHAQEVIDFLDRMQSMDERMLLILHCDAGISRSGAVGRFSADYLDLAFEDKYILPNPYVSRILNEQIWRAQWKT